MLYCLYRVRILLKGRILNCMNHQGMVNDFLDHCRHGHIKKVHCANVSLLANTASGDFEHVYLEFDDCCFDITTRLVLETKEDAIRELHISRIDDLTEIQAKIFKTISCEQHSIEFVTELVDEYGSFDGIELKTGSYYLFLLAMEDDIAVTASVNEWLKHELYSHQFGRGHDPMEREYVLLFT